MLDLDEVKAHWKEATEGLAGWRTETRESYDFASCKQWDSEDLSRLEDEERPAVTFDRIGVFIDAVSGMEMNNRQAIKYLPVEQGDVRVNDTLTQAVKYYENDCGAEDEDSEAARDAVICGIGCTETIISTDKNPDGAPTVVRRDPLSLWYDPNANRRNLSDRRYQFHGDWIPLEEAKQRWPDGTFSSEPPDATRMHYADRAFEYNEDNADPDTNRTNQAFILHYQCWKRETVFRLRDPQTQQVVELTSKQFKAAKDLFATQYGIEPEEQRDYIKSTRKVYYRAFLSGNEILEQDRLPVQAFTFNFVTYKRDRNQRRWYGLVRVMKDPQRWANKWLSQILHIVNTNAKGGALAEEGAFRDPRKAEEQWAQANPLIIVREGMIEKVKPREQAQYPNGLDRLMQFAFNALPMVSGLNLEVLGLADREQAGVLEAQRRQSAFTILAPFFAAIREYRKSRGRLMLMFLKFIPQGTLVKIVGQRGEQWAPLIHDNLTYDVKVDQAPDSPDYKKQVWEALGQILPPMMKAGYPIPPEVINFSPLPPDISEQWVQWIKTQGWMPPEHKKQMDNMAQQLQRFSQENLQLKEQNMMLRLDHSTEVQKLAIKQNDGMERNAVKVYQAQLESMNARIETALKAQKDAWDAMLQAEKLKLDQRMKAVETVADNKIKTAQTQIQAFEAAVKAHETSIKAQEARENAKAKKKVKARKIQDGVWEIAQDG